MFSDLEALRDALDQALALHTRGILAPGTLPPKYRALLLNNGYLLPIHAQWFLLNYPAYGDGSEAWRRGYWSFVRLYLSQRWGENYCLDATSTLLCRAVAWEVPQELVVWRREPGSALLELRQGNRLRICRTKLFPSKVENVLGIWVMEQNEALLQVSLSFLQANVDTVRTVLPGVQDTESLLALLHENGQHRKANWILQEMLAREKQGEYGKHLTENEVL